MLRKILAAGVFAGLLVSADSAIAQAPPTVKLCVQNGTTCTPVNSSSPLPVNASVSASITGFPGTSQTTGTPISATTGGVTGSLPAGTEVVASNIGSTNTAFCKLGASASVNDQPIPPNSWFGFTVGSNTQITCITSTSTTTVNLVGGSGLPTGAGGGGGSGGGGGGAVFGPTAVGSAVANPPVMVGGSANGTGTGNVSIWEVVSGIGYVNNAQVNGVAISTGAGATGTGTQRVGVAQDTATIAGSAPGTAGSASTNVLTVQGIASMTPFLANPGTAANWGIGTSTQNSATVANGQLALGQFNTTPTTITSGNMSPLQMDNAGNLLVNVKAGGAGGTVAQGNAGSNAQSWWTQIGDTARGPAKVQAGNSAAASDVALTVADPNVLAAVNSPIPAGTNIIGKVGIDQTTPGTTNGVQVNAALPAGTNVIGFNSNDPCAQATKLGAPISLTASGQVITGVASKKTYICSIDLVSATAQNIALVEGTGTTCATNIYGLAGGTTAATGWNLSANGGLTKGSGSGTVYSPSGDANGTAANVCLLLSGSGQTSGQITYVQQ